MYWSKVLFHLRQGNGNRNRETTMSSVLGRRRWLRLLERKVWRLHAHQKAPRTTVGNWRIKRWQEIQYLGWTCAVFGQTVYHDVEVRMQRKWARSIEAVDETLLQFRDAACDELARATNVSVVEAKLSRWRTTWSEPRLLRLHQK